MGKHGGLTISSVKTCARQRLVSIMQRVSVTQQITNASVRKAFLVTIVNSRLALQSLAKITEPARSLIQISNAIVKMDSPDQRAK